MDNIALINNSPFERLKRFSPRINKSLLVLFDILAFLVSFIFSVSVVGGFSLGNFNYHYFFSGSALSFALTSFVSIAWFWGAKRHYTYRKPFWDELYDVLKVLSFMAIISIALSALLSYSYPVNQWALGWGATLVSIPMFRGCAKYLLDKMGTWKMPCAIIGDTGNARDILLAIKSEPSTGLEVIAVISPESDAVDSEVFGISYISREEFTNRIGEFSKVFIATEKHQNLIRDSWIRLLTKLRVQDISIVPALRGVPLQGTDISHFFSHEVMVLRLKNNLPRKSSRIVKRVFDICVSSILLIFLSPLFAYIAWKVSRDGGPATYGHERVGLFGRKFRCLKFRSMVVNSKEVLENLLATDEEARNEWDREFKLKNDPRVTPLGRFLRRTSLDELPQLWNVLRGEMSLVGPRPVIDEELLRYNDDVDYYLLAKPGMSGLWQVSGRSDTDYDTRVYLDSWYVKNWSLWSDIVILFKTINVVLKNKGAY